MVGEDSITKMKSRWLKYLPAVLRLGNAADDGGEDMSYQALLFWTSASEELGLDPRVQQHSQYMQQVSQKVSVTGNIGPLDVYLTLLDLSFMYNIVFFLYTAILQPSLNPEGFSRKLSDPIL